MKKIRDILELSRIGNVAITGFSVLIGTGGYVRSVNIHLVIMAAVSAMIIAAGGNAQNDYYDQKTDAINRPERPIPSGRISPRFAIIFSILCYIAGIVLGWLIGRETGLVASAVAVLLWLYAARGKMMGLGGNLIIALICALAFIYGGLAVKNPVLAVFPAVFALLMHLSREIIKDVQDVSGDRQSGARTLVIRAGHKKALSVSAFSLMLLVSLSPVPYLLEIYNIRYLLAVVLGVDLVILPIIFQLLKDPMGVDCAKLSFILKIDMLVGLMAIALGMS
jgi:geranylgeranylglycerol-phosphate geranylgeranyltransferase